MKWVWHSWFRRKKTIFREEQMTISATALSKKSISTARKSVDIPRDEDDPTQAERKSTASDINSESAVARNESEKYDIIIKLSWLVINTL